MRPYACWGPDADNPRDIYRLDDPALRRTPQFYYACPVCGWCGPLRLTGTSARWDGVRHFAAKAAAA
jgi:hypothetical protein